MLRVKSSSETLQLITSQLRRFDISRIADLTYLDNTTDLYVYSVIRPSAKSLTTSMGKGVTIEDAKCSALVESIETYYAEEVQPDFKKNSLIELQKKGHLVLNPNDILRYASISEYFPMDWCYGKLLCSENEIIIPHCLLSLDSNLIIPRLIGQNSNGLASGNCLEEAIIFSFWELNERFSIYNSYTHLCIDKRFYSKFISNFLSVNFNLHENIFNLPVISCQLKNKNPLDNAKIFAGYACRSSLAKAAYAALFEAIQSKTGIIAGLRDDITNDCYLFSGCKVSQESFIQDKIENIDFESSEKSIIEEFDKLKKMLYQQQKDLAYYCYAGTNLVVVKSFLVNRS